MILTGSKTLVDVKTQLLKMYLINLGSKECLFALVGEAFVLSQMLGKLLSHVMKIMEW